MKSGIDKREKSCSSSWITQGFEAFRAGEFGNGGQNIYVSKKGVLQRIHQTDITRNGYADLVFCNSQNHEEFVPVDVYPEPLLHPEISIKLHIGGACSGVVADISGDGWEDMVWACTWDGMTLLNNSVIFYGSEEGLNNHYLKYLPASLSTAVAAGDFNGDGKIDLVFYSKGRLQVFYQSDNGFGNKECQSYDISDVKQLLAIKERMNLCSDLLIRKEDGTCLCVPGTENGLDFSAILQLCAADADFQKVEWSWDNYRQAVEEPTPLLQVFDWDGQQFLAILRCKGAWLYPYKQRTLGEPIFLDCENPMGIAAGDIARRGCIDLVVACRDNTTGLECSWIYPGHTEQKLQWRQKDRIPIKTMNACDVVLADFSDRGGLDIAICQSHSYESYTHEVLIYPTSACGFKPLPKPLSIPAHNAYRILVVKTGKNKRPALVVGNRLSGSLIGNPDNCVYIGGPDGFHEPSKLELPGWGSTDMVCCDFNDDGMPDLAFANAAELSPWLDPGSFVFLQTKQGFSRIPQTLATTRAHGVVCGDLNHDGWLDLVFCGFDNSVIKIFFGSEKGYSNDHVQEIVMEENGKAYSEPRFLALADLNGDGWLDLIIPLINEDVSFVLWGGPNGFSFENKQRFNVRHACNAKVADLNGDGYPELLFGGHTQSVSEPHNAFLYIYWGGPDGFREDRCTQLPSNAINSIAVADFNNDGLLDIFIASYENGRERDLDSYIYWNRAGRGFLPWDRLPLRTHAVSGNMAADFNADGWIDLAVANHKVQGEHMAYSTVWYNGPEGFNEKNTVNLPTAGPHSMGNVDVGNILNRSPDEYYISLPKMIPDGMGISSVYWEGEVPEKTWVKIQFRMAEDEAGLCSAKWLGPTGTDTWFNSGQRVDKFFFSGPWIQYRLKLGAFNSINTPRISKIVVCFEKLGN